MKNLYLYLWVLTIAFSGFLSGFDCGVISGAILYIQNTFNVSSSTIGLLVSSISFGAIIGAIINGLIVDNIGRRKTLLICATLFFLGSILCSVSNSIFMLIVSRIIVGSAVGIVSFCGPLYLSEISNSNNRGMFVSLYQLLLTFGILFSYFVNYIFSNSIHNWRLMLLFGFLPSLILFIGLMFQKDTPRWLVLKNKIDEAKNIIEKIYPQLDSAEFILNIQSTLNFNNQYKFQKWLLKPILLGLGIMFFQVATGINAIIYYAPTIFKNIGFAQNKTAICATILIGLINFVMTIPAIKFVDKIGRKPILYFGLLGMSFSLILLILCYSNLFINIKILALVAILFYIVCFSTSLGPLAFILISEIYPLSIRGKMMSISIVTNFIVNFLVAYLFPISLNSIGGFYTFLIFLLICIFAILFVKFFIPETKGISLEKIENYFRN